MWKSESFARNFVEDPKSEIKKGLSIKAILIDFIDNTVESSSLQNTPWQA